NLFGRIDFQISPVHRFVVRQIINHDDKDDFFRNVNTFSADPLLQNAGFRFGSNGFTRKARNNSTTAQLYSNFPSGRSNELIIGYSTIKVERLATPSDTRTAGTRPIFRPISTSASTACTDRTSGR